MKKQVKSAGFNWSDEWAFTIEFMKPFMKGACIGGGIAFLFSAVAMSCTDGDDWKEMILGCAILTLACAFFGGFFALLFGGYALWKRTRAPIVRIERFLNCIGKEAGVQLGLRESIFQTDARTFIWGLKSHLKKMEFGISTDEASWLENVSRKIGEDMYLLVIGKNDCALSIQWRSIAMLLEYAWRDLYQLSRQEGATSSDPTLKMLAGLINKVYSYTDSNRIYNEELVRKFSLPSKILSWQWRIILLKSVGRFLSGAGFAMIVPLVIAGINYAENDSPFDRHLFLSPWMISINVFLGILFAAFYIFPRLQAERMANKKRAVLIRAGIEERIVWDQNKLLQKILVKRWKRNPKEGGYEITPDEFWALKDFEVGENFLLFLEALRDSQGHGGMHLNIETASYLREFLIAHLEEDGFAAGRVGFNGLLESRTEPGVFAGDDYSLNETGKMLVKLIERLYTD